MKIRSQGIRTMLIGCAAWAALGLAPPALAELINIDVEGDPPNDTTHSGADGILSGAGVVWNGVESGVDATDLQDEQGFTTPVDVVFSSTGGGTTDANATNDLQDSGTIRTFDVKGLSDTDTYDIAIYAGPFSFLRFTDSSGATTLSCTGSPTYGLPGSLLDDYCLFEDRLPADLGGGEFGFNFMPLDGVVMGVQIRRVLGNGEGPVSVPALQPLGLLALVLCLLGAGVWSMRAASSLRARA